MSSSESSRKGNLNEKAKVPSKIIMEDDCNQKWVPLEDAQVYETAMKLSNGKIVELNRKIVEANKILDEKCDRQLHCPWVCKIELREALK
jgi:hypothetical protein